MTEREKPRPGGESGSAAESGRRGPEDTTSPREIERAAQALADRISGAGRTAWALVVEDPAQGEQLFTCETPARARALLKRAAERRS